MGKKRGRPAANEAVAEEVAVEQVETEQVAEPDEAAEAASAASGAEPPMSDEEFDRYVAEQQAAQATAPVPAPRPAAQPPAAAPRQAVPRPGAAAAAPRPVAPRPAVPAAAPRPAAPRPVAPPAARPAVAPAPVAAQTYAAAEQPETAIVPQGMTQPGEADMTITDGEYPILNVHAQAADAMKFVTESAFDMSAWDMPRIKVPRGGECLWQYMTADGPVSAEYLSGILVFFKEGRDFWSVVYGGGEGSVPPSCSSLDGRTGVGDPGGNCLTCPWNQWGSRAQIDASRPDSNAKACRHTARLFIAQAGSSMPTLIVAPPTSLKRIRQYAMSLAGLGFYYFGVETHLGLVPVQSGGFQVAQINPVKGRVLNSQQCLKARAMLESFKSMFTTMSPMLDEAGSD